MGDESILAQYLASARNGDANAQYQLWSAYYFGTGGVQKDLVKALEFCTLAAEQNAHLESLAQLGYMYSVGEGTDQDSKQAVKWTQAAANAGHAQAQYNLGYWYECGYHGLVKNMQAALTWYANGAAANHQHSLQAQQRLTENPVPKYYDAAMGGDTLAQHKLWYAYYYGLGGVTKDLSQAFTFAKMGAEANHEEACVNLGWMYSIGEGCDQDQKLAVKWTEIAAGMFGAGRNNTLGFNHGQAQYNLGYWHETGMQGFTKNLEVAKQYYERSSANKNVNGMAAWLRFTSDPIAKYYSQAEAGDVTAQHQLWSAYYYGTGVTKNLNKAYDYAMRAAQQNHGESMTQVGWMTAVGEGTTQDNKEAIRWTTIAARKYNQPQAQYNLGYWNELGSYGLSKNLDNAREYYGMAAENKNAFGIASFQRLQTDPLTKWLPLAQGGDANAQYQLCSSYYNGIGGLPKDFKKAYEWGLKGAKTGNVDCQTQIGFMHSTGEGCAQDSKEALRWTRAAAEQHSGQAEYNLGFWYEVGSNGCNRDLAQAIKWYVLAGEHGFSNGTTSAERLTTDPVAKHSAAAAKGDTFALHQLWSAYYYGTGGVAKNYEKAFEYARTAANLNHPESVTQLGWMYSSGEGVERDPEAALKWTTKAAVEMKQAQAQYNLAYWTEMGAFGLARDMDAARALYRTGALQQHLHSIAACNRLGVAIVEPDQSHDSKSPKGGKGETNSARDYE